MRGSRTRVAFSRRQALAGAAALPLLPAVSLAAGRPRYRKRRKTTAVAAEHELFAAGPLDQARVQGFIDSLWARLQRSLVARGKPAYRQGDLLAGLALRYGRTEVLAALAETTAAQPGWETRRAKWLAPESGWRRRWTRSGTVTWAWHDGGHLTRSRLPLKLPP